MSFRAAKLGRNLYTHIDFSPASRLEMTFRVIFVFVRQLQGFSRLQTPQTAKSILFLYI
jgi:hypothetical protein